MSPYPERIVCLTEETTETLYLLGQGHRIVGVSGYTVRPPEARSKPKVSAFISANVEKIETLRPELVTIAGGDPVFPELERAALARDRIVTADEVARRDPEVVFASWCGKKVRKATFRTRSGWDAVSAVRSDRIFEIKSTYILQPGPACLTEGVRQLHALLARAHGIEIDRALSPREPLDSGVCAPN